MKLKIEDFIKIRDFIYEHSGLFFEEKKIYFLKKRLASRMEALDLDTPKEYLWLLRFGDPDGKEFQELTNLITTNETYFFREFDQLAVFGENCLLETCERKKQNGDRTLRIWSAGCSTGEEAYTISIILLEMLERYHSWNVEIFGSDIDTGVLNKAMAGIYSKRCVKDVPDEYLEKYFTLDGENYRVRLPVKRPVSFCHMNLFDRQEMRSMKKVDFIFCRNVLIYFDEVSRRKVVNDFYESLNNEGYIFLGHSESVSRISTAFTLRRKNGFLVYQKLED